MIKILISIILFSSLLPTAYAGGFSEDWSYVFHLQSMNGVLSTEMTNGESYTPVPERYIEKIDPVTSDYYGIIKNIKGKQTARFGFNEPTTIVTALEKSLFDVRAPFFADADHVEFYTQKGKHLFDISLKGSSFCDDDLHCDEDVGENYINCPYDCPPPIETPIGTPGSLPQIEPIASSGEPVAPQAVGSVSNTTTPSSTSTKITTTLIVLVCVFVVLLIVLWRIRKFTSTT